MKDLSLPKVGDVQYSFASEEANTANNDLLDTAKDLETRGVSSEEIRRSTGWFRGMDGKWRFEIDDSGMSVKLPEYAFNHLRNLIRHEKFRVYAQLLYDVQFQRGLHLLKLYAEEILDNHGTDVFSRAYEDKDIKEIAPVAKGVHSKGGLTQATNAKSGYSVADQYGQVKRYDRVIQTKESS